MQSLKDIADKARAGQDTSHQYVTYEMQDGRLIVVYWDGYAVYGFKYFNEGETSDMSEHYEWYENDKSADFNDILFSLLNCEYVGNGC